MSKSKIQISELVKPFPKQREFLTSARTHKYTLFGGAAGPGKSYILRWWLIIQLLRWFVELRLRNVRVGLFCEDYPSLEDRHISRIKTEFPSWLGTYNEQHHDFTLDPCYGGGVMSFRNLDKAEKYQSVEFAAIAVDELTQNDRTVFDLLRSRLRWPGIEFSPFAAATNPGGRGHAWVKKLWVDRDFSGDDAVLDPGQFIYIPAKAEDNPALPASYHQTLDSLPESLRKAYRDGDWNIFVGQFFTEWRADLHVCKPFEVPATWLNHKISVDWGYGAPWSAHFWVRDEDAWTQQRIQRWYCYHELYEKMMKDHEQARMIRSVINIVDKHQKERGGQPIRWSGVGDPAMWSKKPGYNTSVADVYLGHPYRVPIHPANNERVLGWQRVRQFLDVQEDGKPAIIYWNTCHNAIRTIPAQVYDKLDPEDLDTEAEDHAADDLRYFVMSLGPIEPRQQVQETYGFATMRQREGAVSERATIFG